MEIKPTLKDIVKDSNTATFSFYRNGNIFYNVVVEGICYQFSVDAEDLGGASVSASEKAITLMRYIRKSLENQTFVKVL